MSRAELLKLLNEPVVVHTSEAGKRIAPRCYWCHSTEYVPGHDHTHCPGCGSYRGEHTVKG